MYNVNLKYITEDMFKFPENNISTFREIFDSTTYMSMGRLIPVKRFLSNIGGIIFFTTIVISLVTGMTVATGIAMLTALFMYFCIDDCIDFIMRIRAKKYGSKILTFKDEQALALLKHEFEEIEEMKSCLRLAKLRDALYNIYYNDAENEFHIVYIIDGSGDLTDVVFSFENIEVMRFNNGDIMTVDFAMCDAALEVLVTRIFTEV